MRLLTLGSLGGLLLLTHAACTAEGSTTTVQGPGGTSGAPVFPVVGDGTDGGSTQNPGAADYEALFGPPATTTATPDSLPGLWAGSAGVRSIDTRMQFKGTSILIAQKCGQTIGLTVAASVVPSSIKTLESKTATATIDPNDAGGGIGATCALKVVPVEIPACMSTTSLDAETESGSLDNGCFFLSGTKLSFYNSTALAGSVNLTKLSD